MSGFIPAIVAELFFAFAGIFYKLGIESGINSLTLVYGRLLMACLILSILWLIKRGWQLLRPDQDLPFKIVDVKRRLPAFEDLSLFALLGVFFPASTLLLCIAIQSSSLATSNLLHNLTPVFITLFSLFILKKASNKFIVMGLLITFLGLVILEFPVLKTDWSTFLSGGSAIAIVSALANACHVLTVGKLKNRGYTNVTILFWMSLLGVVYLVPVMAVLKIDLFPPTEFGWLLIFALGFLVQIIAQLLVLKSLNILPPEIASSFFLLEPVMATGLGYVFFAEQLTGLMMIGFTVILGGLLVLCLPNTSSNLPLTPRLKPKLIT
jgi:drug/metabolite transporter (DMT)-like permease